MIPPAVLAVRLAAISKVQHESILAFDQGRGLDFRKLAKEAAAMVAALKGEALLEVSAIQARDESDERVDRTWEEATGRRPVRRQWRDVPALIDDMSGARVADMTSIPLPSKVGDPAATRDLLMANGEPVPLPSCLPALLMALGAFGLAIVLCLMAAGVIPVHW